MTSPLDELIRRLDRLERRVGSIETGFEAPGAWTTYTPTYFGRTTAGVTTYAADGQVGQYCRIGKTCLVSGWVSWTNATGTGDGIVSLPFTSPNRTSYQSTISVALVSITFTANASVSGVIGVAMSVFALYPSSTGVAASFVPVDTAGSIAFAGLYEIA